MKYLFTSSLILFSVLVYAQQPMALLHGVKAPAIETTNYNEETYSLEKALADGPVVVVFYRGEWCSYCNRHMAALEEAIPRFEELGATVVAISPELPRYVRKTVKKSNASFNIISDPNHKIMDRWQVSFRLDDITYERYKTFGIKVDRASGNKDRILPVPATYIVGTDGTIQHVDFNKDYTERMPVSDILEVLTGLK